MGSHHCALTLLSCDVLPHLRFDRILWPTVAQMRAAGRNLERVTRALPGRDRDAWKTLTFRADCPGWLRLSTGEDVGPR